MPVTDKIRRDMAAGSLIRRMFEEGNRLKEQYGAEHVFDLSLGNPVMEPPPKFRAELKKLAEAPVPGMHRYMKNAGYEATRAAVAAELAAETGLAYSAAEVVMTCGAAGAINAVLKTVLEPGDEVIVFAPYFVEYLFYIDNHGGVPRVLPTGDGFLPRPDELAAALNSRIRAVIINSPNNPTGVVYPAGLLKELGDLLEKAGKRHGTEIYLISDEPYRRLVYDGRKYPFPAQAYRRTVMVTSHSKDLALPGERIGYLAVCPDCPGKDELVSGFVFCNRILGFVNAPALMQHIVERLQNVSVSVDEYQRKRDYLYEGLVSCGYELIKPAGAFYMFPKSPLADDVAFVQVLQEQKVLAVPGSGFGAPGFFRVAYCVDDSTLEGALAGLKKAAETAGPG